MGLLAGHGYSTVPIRIAECKGDHEDGLPFSISIGNDLAQLLHVLLCCLRCLPLLLLCHLGSCWSICCSIGCFCLSDRTLVISRRKAVGFSTSACASGRGLSKTIAINMSPPSSWMSAGRPFCNWSRIAAALFSQIVRFHSSTARCIWVAFCGGI